MFEARDVLHNSHHKVGPAAARSFSTPAFLVCRSWSRLKVRALCAAACCAGPARPSGRATLPRGHPAGSWRGCGAAASGSPGSSKGQAQQGRPYCAALMHHDARAYSSPAQALSSNPLPHAGSQHKRKLPSAARRLYDRTSTMRLAVSQERRESHCGRAALTWVSGSCTFHCRRGGSAWSGEKSSTAAPLGRTPEQRAGQ